jgi:two-component system chemotaxis response regulator CheB
MIRVLIVDDSKVVQIFLEHILTTDPFIEVAGVANNGKEAIEAAKQKRPDVITMDIHMPIMDGFEATRKIMETTPTPIVIVSASTSSKGVASVFRAMEAGALAVILRPQGIGHPEHETDARELIQTVKLMSEVRVVRRAPAEVKQQPFFTPSLIQKHEIKIVAIGASTGGPPVLRKILSSLPQDLPFSILIVQHISPGFIKGFGEWLAGASGFPVRIASNGEYPLPGQVYIAPQDFHMGIGMGPRIVLSDHAPENGLRPSVAYLFRTVAEHLGPAAVGILLTGMGKDGAEELKMMKQTGAITIAQNKESAVVHGMPGEAIKLGAVTHVLPPEGIADFLVALTKR